jgi:hypothetical protein
MCFLCLVVCVACPPPVPSPEYYNSCSNIYIECQFYNTHPNW